MVLKEAWALVQQATLAHYEAEGWPIDDELSEMSQALNILGQALTRLELLEHHVRRFGEAMSRRWDIEERLAVLAEEQHRMKMHHGAVQTALLANCCEGWPKVRGG